MNLTTVHKRYTPLEDFLNEHNHTVPQIKKCVIEWNGRRYIDLETLAITPPEETSNHTT